MDINEYQTEVKRTANPETTLLGWVVGLAGETGEVCEIAKKMVEHKILTLKGKDIYESLEEELGDVLFYLASTANYLGLDLQRIMEKNISKLKERYPNGFEYGGGNR